MWSIRAAKPGASRDAYRRDLELQTDGTGQARRMIITASVPWDDRVPEERQRAAWAALLLACCREIAAQDVLPVR